MWKEVAVAWKLDTDLGFEAIQIASKIGNEARTAMGEQFPEYVCRCQFSLEWLTALWLSLDARADAERSTPNKLAPFAVLAGKAVNDLLATMRLVEDGLDAPARVVLRSFVETCLVIIVLAARPELVPGFVRAQDTEEVRRFWYKHLRPQRLNSQLVIIEQEISPRIPTDLTELLRSWRREALERLSGFVHPSYVPAVVNHYPDFVRSSDIKVGILGAPSAGRIFVLHEAWQWTWYFSLVLPGAFAVAHRSGKGHFIFDKERILDRYVLAGCECLTMLALKHWNDDYEDLDTGFEEE